MKRRLTTDEILALLGLVGLFAGLALALSVGWGLTIVSALVLAYAVSPDRSAT